MLSLCHTNVLDAIEMYKDSPVIKNVSFQVLPPTQQNASSNRTSSIISIDFTNAPKKPLSFSVPFAQKKKPSSKYLKDHLS